jgi:hypothetical protein
MERANEKLPAQRAVVGEVCYGESRLFAAPAMKSMLYTRRGCHLCDAARDMLAAVAPGLAAEITPCDVDADPSLERLYGDRVPVLVVDGVVVLEGRFDEVDVLRAVHGLTARASAPAGPAHPRVPPPT